MRESVNKLEIICVQETFTEVLVSLQNVTGKRKVTVLARDKEDVLERLRREHLVVKELCQLLQSFFWALWC